MGHTRGHSQLELNVNDVDTYVRDIMAKMTQIWMHLFYILDTTHTARAH